MTQLKPHRVSAYNLARESENRIHDDSVARRFGFHGALVPGVEVCGYMAHMPVMKWGRAFLERGRMDARLMKPVYDGDVAVVTAAEAEGALAMAVESHEEVCASGHATLQPSAPKLALDDFEDVAPVVNRAPVDAYSFRTGTWLGIAPYTQGADAALQYLQDVRETDPIYADQMIVHPGMLLRLMNWALMANVVLGAWIHVGSTIQHLNVALVGDELTVRARVTDNYERKRHKFVNLDGLIVANGTTPIAHCQHIAIYQPRETVAA
jgi:acyl dehydratase